MSNRRRKTLTAVVLLAAAAAVWALWERAHPSAFPQAHRFLLEFPRPLLSRQKVLAMLAPAPGEHILEVGPGTGYYTLDVALALEPGGKVDAIDIQQPMLDELHRRAANHGITNIATTRGDARTLPYPAETFDAALVVAVLGEVVEPRGTLREIRRVLKPNGRLIVGEGQPDPHMIPSARLQELAQSAGLRFELQEGGRLGHIGRFRAT